jgi:hypothetical protein
VDAGGCLHLGRLRLVHAPPPQQPRRVRPRADPQPLLRRRHLSGRPHPRWRCLPAQRRQGQGWVVLVPVATLRAPPCSILFPVAGCDAMLLRARHRGSHDNLGHLVGVPWPWPHAAHPGFLQCGRHRRRIGESRDVRREAKAMARLRDGCNIPKIPTQGLEP